MELGVGHGRGDGDDGGFAGAGGFEVFAVEEDQVELRRVGETGDAVARCNKSFVAV